MSSSSRSAVFHNAGTTGTVGAYGPLPIGLENGLANVFYETSFWPQNDTVYPLNRGSGYPFGYFHNGGKSSGSGLNAYQFGTGDSGNAPGIRLRTSLSTPASGDAVITGVTAGLTSVGDDVLVGLGAVTSSATWGSTSSRYGYFGVTVLFEDVGDVDVLIAASPTNLPSVILPVWAANSWEGAFPAVTGFHMRNGTLRFVTTSDAAQPITAGGRGTPRTVVSSQLYRLSWVLHAGVGVFGFLNGVLVGQSTSTSTALLDTGTNGSVFPFAGVKTSTNGQKVVRLTHWAFAAGSPPPNL